MEEKDNNIDLNDEKEKENNNIIEENNIIEKKDNQGDNEEEDKIISENTNNIIQEEEKEIKTDNNNLNINASSSKKGEKSKKNELRLSKSISDIDPEKLKNIPVYIYTTKNIEVNGVSVLIYFLKGKLIEKEILRTFNDFQLYYQALTKMWPCITVPFVYFSSSDPSAKTIENFPEIKTKMLNHFLKKLIESKELLKCELTKIFISQDKNFAGKMLYYINNNNYQEIAERYLKLFTYYVEDTKVTKEKEAYIKKFMKLLDATLKRLNEVGKTIENEIFNIKNEQKSLDFITAMFIDLEKSIPSKKKYLTNIESTMKPLKTVSYNKYYFLFFIFYNYRMSL